MNKPTILPSRFGQAGSLTTSTASEGNAGKVCGWSGVLARRHDEHGALRRRSGATVVGDVDAHHCGAFRDGDDARLRTERSTADGRKQVELELGGGRPGAPRSITV
jgi:hypothetical protein